MKYILSFIIVSVLSLSFLKFLSTPYFWIGLLWSMLFMVFFIKEKREGLEAIFLNVAIITFLLTGIEFYFWAPFSKQPIYEGNFWTTYNRDKLLGYKGPINKEKIVGKLRNGKDTIYEMTFSTDENGYRKSYPKNSKINQAIIFYGCSFTFGIGLNDDQTLSYQTGLRTKNKFNTYNFSYGGYGPHQMLASLQNSLDKKVIIEEPKLAIYTAIIDHVARSAGLASWGQHDPKYELDNQGELNFIGYFDDHSIVKNIWCARILGHLNKSYLFKKIYSPHAREVNDTDFARYIKIVVKAKEIFESRYSGSEFQVILWSESDVQQEKYNKILNALVENNIIVHQIKDILPDFQHHHSRYFIAGDGHPTAHANELIAQYISQKVS